MLCPSGQSQDPRINFTTGTSASAFSMVKNNSNVGIEEWCFGMFCDEPSIVLGPDDNRVQIQKPLDIGPIRTLLSTGLWSMKPYVFIAVPLL
ncbi:hypothetical protein NPIL_554631 [Nephila pilipes]|uniref:Uncharacterized protein n=1 Tax=Nephila pilipes TaxID=299642 RepID=A0A8X6QKI1_NEPPI|nr:hypothetical protein NPIL_554631 [Nephila pilipes]